MDDSASTAHTRLQLAMRVDTPVPLSSAPFVVLYLHGLASSQGGEKAAFFRRRVLAAGLPFCSFDFQGHGESPGDLDGLTLSRNLADTASVQGRLADAGCPRVLVLGSSMGALTGLWHAALHPDQVVAGLHVAPALGLQEEILESLAPAEVRAWELSGSREFSRYEGGAFRLSWGFVEDLRAYRLTHLAARHRAPALLLHGARDDRVAWRRVAAFAADAAGPTELHLFSDGDHRLLDRKQRLWELMESFLRLHGLLPASVVR